VGINFNQIFMMPFDFYSFIIVPCAESRGDVAFRRLVLRRISGRSTPSLRRRPTLRRFPVGFFVMLF
jgi:hypothetical protein